MDDANSECEPTEDSLEEGKPILIVGFTGETAYQFLKINRTSSGIYVIPRYRGIGPHVSYHASGETHTVYVDQNGKRIKTDKKQVIPLAKFQGEYNLGIWTPYAVNLPIRKELTISKERKSQLIVYFDMTHLIGNLSINVRLVESGHIDLLEKLFKPVSLIGGQILAITDQNPWIILTLAVV